MIPEFITQDPEGYFYYNPSGIEAILTAAIQELNNKVERLEIDNHQLKQEINDLKIKK